MQRRLAIFFAAALVALVSVLGVTACGGVQEKGQEQKQKAEKMGGGGENAPSGAKQTAVKTIQVKEMEFRLNPAEITLNKPGTYVFCPSLTEGLRLFNTGVRASV